jgi:hypothetical protein
LSARREEETWQAKHAWVQWTCNLLLSKISLTLGVKVTYNIVLSGHDYAEKKYLRQLQVAGVKGTYN